MKHPLRKLSAILSFTVFVVSAALHQPLPGQVVSDPSSQIRQELERLQRSLSHKPNSDSDWKEAKPEIEQSVTNALHSVREKRLYAGLESLADANRSFRALEASKWDPAVSAKGAPAFDSEWKKTSKKLTSTESAAQKRDWSDFPAAIQALSDTAQEQTMVLLEASRAYANVTNPESGLYYLGQARAAAEFAAFCYSLHLRRQPTAFHARSALPELQRLQERINTIFLPPRSIERHADFIRLGATLKVAGELDAAGRYAAAWYQYLSGVEQLGELEAVAPNEAKAAELQRAIATMRRRLDSTERDDSIAQIFLERAEAQATDAVSGSSKGEWTSVQVIVEQVIPAYFAAMENAPAKEQMPASTVTVTLVRWPFT